MTVDWFVLLTPLALLVIAFPLLFVGCGSFSAAPVEPAKPQPPPDPSPGQTQGGGAQPPPPPPKPPPKTSFRLEMDPNLQEGLGNKPVVKISVQWVLESVSTPAPPLSYPTPNPAVIFSQQVPLPNPPAIDPMKDKGALFEIESLQIATSYERVRCVPVVELAGGGNPPLVLETNTQQTFMRDRVHEFRIQSNSPKPGFRVYFLSTGP